MSLTDRCLTRLIEGTVRKISTRRFKNRTELRYAGTVRSKMRGMLYANSERTVPNCHPW